MNRTSLDAGRVPALRWRLMLLVSIASLAILVLASAMSYRRARHEVQELMDDQMAKTVQLLLAEAMEGEAQLADLSQRMEGVRGLRSRRNQLTLEYQVGRPDGTVLVRSPRAPETPLSAGLGYNTIEAESGRWRSLILESANGAYRVQVVESIVKRDREALEIAFKTVQPLAYVFPLLLLAIYISVRRGLRPLDALALEVATRSPDNLSPLAARAVPREAQPLVAAINRVFYRLGISLDAERRFTADAAHELRTPLAAARIQAQVAQLTGDPDKRNHALHLTLAGLDRAARLVDQMLRLARLDPLAQLPQHTPVDLGDLVQRAVAAARDAAPEAAVSAAVDGAPDCPVQGDAELLETALRNLIDNALRYSPAGSEVTVSLRQENGDCVLSVSDSGPGVPEQELPRLRERFYRGASVTAEGSGLGLTIVARIAELHGAMLELSNRAAGGFEAGLRWRGAA